MLALALQCTTGGGAIAASNDFRITAVPDWVVPIDADVHASAPLDEVRNGAYYLLSDQQVKVDGQDRQRFIHIAAKALNETGVEQIANVEIGFDPTYQRLRLHSIVLRRDGRSVSKLSAGAVKVLQREANLERQLLDGTKTAHVFLEDVRVGDVVEYAYTLSGVNPVFQGRHSGRFDMQWSSPLHRMHARLLWPEGRALHLKNMNAPPQAVQRQLGNYREYVWAADKVAPLHWSAGTPSWFDPYMAVAWSEYENWAAVAKWAVPLYRVPDTLSAELKAQVERIAREGRTPAERLAAALLYVQKSIRYLGMEIGTGSYVPTAPAKVLERRFGDCKDKTLLTLTLLQALGIEARPALVNTRMRRGMTEQSPSPNQFNHVMVRARVDGRDYWLDPTWAPQVGNLDNLAQANYGHALIVDADTQDLQAMPQSAATRNVKRLHAEFDITAGMDQPVRYTMTTVLQGVSAESMRSTLASESAQQLQKSYLNYYADSYPGITALAPFSVSDEKDVNRLTITERYQIADFWKTSEEHKRREVLIDLPDMYDYLRAPRDLIRHAPLAVAHPLDIEVVTEVRLPADWNLIAQTDRVDDPAFTLESHSMVVGPRHLKLVDRFQTRVDHIAAEDIARYASNLERARKVMGYQLRSSDAIHAVAWNWRIISLLALAAVGVAGLWGWLAFKLYRYDPVPHPVHEAVGPLMQGGWNTLLIVVLFYQAIGMVLVFGLDFVLALIDDAPDALIVALQVNGGAYDFGEIAVLFANLSMFIGSIFFSALLLRLHSQRRSSFPLVCVAVSWASVAAVLYGALAEPFELLYQGWIWDFAIACVLSVWVYKSKRIRATFVRRYTPANSDKTGLAPGVSLSTASTL